LTSANGSEPGGSPTRLNEQFGYAYDAAGNLNYRTNNALLQAFTLNNLNALTAGTNGGTLTVAGTTTSPATVVTVYGQGPPPMQSAAALYADSTFASLSGFPLYAGSNTFTAIAGDSFGRWSTNTVAAYLPATNAFAYDLNGNLTGDGLRNFAYDDENQITSVWVTNSWRSDFVYDGKMRRRIRREYTWQWGGWSLQSEVHYIYDGNVVIQERDTNSFPLVSYTRGRDLSGSLQGAGGIGGLLARTDHSLLAIGDASAHAFYHADGNGNITSLINGKQAIVAKYLYGPFGSILAQSGSLADANVYRFSSKEFHALSGLVYYLYRYYDPNLQRGLNRDPLGERGGANLYVFIRNSVIARVDSLGLFVMTPGQPTITISGNDVDIQQFTYLPWSDWNEQQDPAVGSMDWYKGTVQWWDGCKCVNMDINEHFDNIHRYRTREVSKQETTILANQDLEHQAVEQIMSIYAAGMSLGGNEAVGIGHDILNLLQKEHYTISTFYSTSQYYELDSQDFWMLTGSSTKMTTAAGISKTHCKNGWIAGPFEPPFSYVNPYE
jgi:RHS repeat-associated protein